MLNLTRHGYHAPPESDVQAFARIHAARPASEFLRNLTTQIELMGSGEHQIPVTVNSGEQNNAWVCSPYTAYCTYAIEEVRRLALPLMTRPITMMCRAAGEMLRRADIDRAVAVNNWLLSTNLYTQLNRDALRTWLNEARERWPTHSIWFRSLNAEWTRDWIEALLAEGCILLPSRQVYLYSGVTDLKRRHSDLKADFRLLARTDLQRCDGADMHGADWCRAEELYRKLYLEKYSQLNPAYRSSFIESWYRAGLLRLIGFRRGGVLQAIVGMFERNGVVTAPLVGYDTTLPQRLGLYRLLMASVLEYAESSDKRVNLSAGAAHFKRGRGGLPAIEYSAVFVDHLPHRQQRAVRALRWLTTHIGVPLMRRFKL